MTVSCVETLDISTGEDLPVVLNCVLQETDSQTVNLHYAKRKSDKSYLPVGSAVIHLMEADSIVATFTESDEYTWTTDFRPKYGKEYTIKAMTGNGTILTATTRFPDDITVDQYWKRIFINNELFVTYSFELRVYDRSYIHYAPYGEGPYLGKCNMWIFPYKRNYSPVHDVGFAEYIGTTHPNADKFNVVGKTYMDFPFYVKYINSRESVIRNEVGWIPLLDIDFPIFKKFVHINHPASFNNGKKWASDDPYYSNGSFFLIADFDSSPPPRPENPAELPEAWIVPGGHGLYRFFFVSDEYDLYLRDTYKLYMNRDNNILTIYENNNLYSNVANGLGVFGAVVQRLNKSANSDYAD